MKTCLKYGLTDCLSGSSSHAQGIVHSPSVCVLQFPEKDSDWIDLTASESISSLLTLDFNNRFVARSVCDSRPAGDVKSINKSAEYLFKCGHVQSIKFAEVNNYYCFMAKCLPEMRKDRIYWLKMALLSDSFDIHHAECGCPAGRGPQGSCKHIASLTYALIDFCQMKSVLNQETCTDCLQQWNRPRGKHVAPIPVDKLGCR